MTRAITMDDCLDGVAIERAADALLDECKAMGPLAHRMGRNFERRLAAAAVRAYRAAERNREKVLPA